MWSTDDEQSTPSKILQKLTRFKSMIGILFENNVANRHRKKFGFALSNNSLDERGFNGDDSR